MSCWSRSMTGSKFPTPKAVCTPLPDETQKRTLEELVGANLCAPGYKITSFQALMRTYQVDPKFLPTYSAKDILLTVGEAVISTSSIRRSSVSRLLSWAGLKSSTHISLLTAVTTSSTLSEFLPQRREALGTTTWR